MLKVFLFLYELVTFILSFPVLLGFALSSKGRVGLFERLGCWAPFPAEQVLWFHGASLGEINGLLPLISLLKVDYPEAKVLVTCTSPSALELKHKHVDEVRLLPFDSSVWLSRGPGRYNLSVMITAETELWPALYSFLERRSVPFCVVNARLSELTFPRYRRLKYVVQWMLRKPALIMTGDKSSHKYLLRLGAPADRLIHTGTTKYDSLCIAGYNLGDSVWKDRLFTICLGSIRPGEEEVWFPVLKRMVDKKKQLQVIIAPRHKEKFSYFADALKAYDLPFIRWSETNEGFIDSDILLLDTYGEMLAAYASAQISFIGATLVNIGGHNPLEAAYQGSYIITGPHYHVIKDVVDALSANDAAWVFSEQAELVEMLEAALTSHEKITAAGERGKEVADRYKGVSKRVAQEIKGILE